VGVINLEDVTNDKGFVFIFLLGAKFHLPVTGWLDPYLGLGIGPIILNAKGDAAGSSTRHSWRGFDIEMRTGANVYLWSVGALKNLSFGPYFKWDFAIWPKVCIKTSGDTVCSSPSEAASDTGISAFNDKPFIFQVGAEAQYKF
jgi:hypothetical protein